MKKNSDSTGIDYARLRFPKPGKRQRSNVSKLRHRRERTERRATAANVIHRVRDEIFRADRVCAICLRPGRETDEMHEVIPRSKTRGLPPEQRFNRRNCVRLHRFCHQSVTTNTVKMAFVDETGMDGGVAILDRDGTIKHIYRRAIVEVAREQP